MSDFVWVPAGETAPAAGMRGRSAYEVAVDHGFVGTVGEWLDSLKGEGGASTWAGIEGKPDFGDAAQRNVGVAGGVAELDETGKVPAARLPSYVDDVVEVANFAALPAVGESGKIYVTIDDDKTWRWGGSVYGEISKGVVLGTTAQTAFRGDHGQVAYDLAQTAVQPVDIAGLPAALDGKEDVGVAAGLVSAIPKFFEGPGIAITEMGDDYQIEALTPTLVPGAGVTIAGTTISTTDLGVTAYDVAGTYSVTPPAGARSMFVELISGGGGGGGGRRGAAGTTRGGGGGGMSGGYFVGFFRLNPGAVEIVVGAGGAGGGAVTTNDTNGNGGTAGGASRVGGALTPYALVGGGVPGIGGSTAGGFGGGLADFAGVVYVLGQPSDGVPGVSGAGNAGAAEVIGVAGTAASLVPAGVLRSFLGKLLPLGSAGGGGGISDANALTTPSTGVAPVQRLAAYNLGTAGTPAAKNAVAPPPAAFALTRNVGYGQGGAGGAASLDSVAGNGAAGSARGGGGGGGGASVNGFNSGAGGAGGAGFVRITWLP